MFLVFTKANSYEEQQVGRTFPRAAEPVSVVTLEGEE